MGCVRKHEDAIVDQETYDVVQKIRDGRRRNNKMGEMRVFSGLVYCSECGKKMYLCRCTTMKQPEYFNCSTYRKKSKNLCTSHQITVNAITAAVKDDLHYTLRYARRNKHEFLNYLIRKTDQASKKEIAEQQRELTGAENRIATLDKIIQNLYDDKVSGNLTDERFRKMSADYEEEQTALTMRTKELKDELAHYEEIYDNINKFVSQVEKYSDFNELTPEIVRSFIDKVIVHEKQKIDGHY